MAYLTLLLFFSLFAQYATACHLHVVYAADAASLHSTLGVPASLQSVRDHSHCQVHCHRFSERLLDGLDAETRDLLRVAAKGRASTQFRDSAAQEAAWLRIFALDAVPEQGWVVYLDADVLVQCDLWQLVGWLKESHASAWLAAVPMPGYRLANGRFFDRQRLMRQHGLRNARRTGFNSGVLAVRAAGWRQHNMTRRVLQWQRRNTEAEHQLFWYDDMASLNLAAWDTAWVRLEHKWNCMDWAARGVQDRDGCCVQHWNGPRKFWSAPIRSDYAVQHTSEAASHLMDKARDIV